MLTYSHSPLVPTNKPCSFNPTKLTKSIQHELMKEIAPDLLVLVSMLPALFFLLNVCSCSLLVSDITCQLNVGRGDRRCYCCCYSSATVQYNFIPKCQYKCTRIVLWCQLHSSHIHSNHKTSLNYNNSKKHPGTKSFINGYTENPSGIKLCIYMSRL